GCRAKTIVLRWVAAGVLVGGLGGSHSRAPWRPSPFNVAYASGASTAQHARQALNSTPRGGKSTAGKSDAASVQLVCKRATPLSHRNAKSCTETPFSPTASRERVCERQELHRKRFAPPASDRRLAQNLFLNTLFTIPLRNTIYERFPPSESTILRDATGHRG